MLKRILVPLDGSTLAESILGHVRKLLVRQDAEVMLLHVLRRGPPAEHGAAERDGETARRKLDEVYGILTGEGARVRIAFMTGDPAEEILKFAEALQPTWIAMSTHGRTGLARVLRGSVAEQVLRRCPFPLFLANPTAIPPAGAPGESAFKRILVPTDGSELSARIIPLVEEFARTYDSEVVLLYVAAIYPDPMEYPVAMILPTSEDAALVVERFASRFDSAKVRVRTRVAFGLPDVQILKAAALEGADLLAMTTHGRTGFSRWMLGSVAEDVLRSSGCPVLMLRAAETCEATNLTAHAARQEA